MNTSLFKPVGKGSFVIQKPKPQNKQKTLQSNQTQTKIPGMYQHMYSNNVLWKLPHNVIYFS